jgi:hypothetical protein
LFDRKITLPSSIPLWVSRVIVTNSIEVFKNLLRFRRNVLVCGNVESRKNFFISSYLGEKNLFRFAGKEVGHASHVILFCRVADIALINKCIGFWPANQINPNQIQIRPGF